MEYYRCENPDCGFTAEMEPDACPAVEVRSFLQ